MGASFEELNISDTSAETIAGTDTPTVATNTIPRVVLLTVNAGVDVFDDAEVATMMLLLIRLVLESSIQLIKLMVVLR